MKIYCQHEIPREADDFWGMLHSPEYESAVAKVIGLAEYRELERREDEKEIYRRIHVTPGLSATLQGVLQRIAGTDSATYVEEQWRSKRTREVRWKITPSVLADRIQLEGVVRVDPAGAGCCTRTLDGEVKVRLLGAGMLIERAVASGAVDAYAKAARVAAKDLS